MSSFKILHKSGKARVGELKTVNGIIETPNFIPVGTQGSVKALSPENLKKIGVQIVLTNTYHLMLRPGIDVISKLGGLHQFMGWNGPIMTDSGGFQVFSLGIALEHGVGKLLREKGEVDPSSALGAGRGKSKPRLNKISEEGVEFQSHLDGSRQILTPEKSIQLQKQLGADLIVAFDDLESPKYSYEETLKSLELTERWELRSLAEYSRQLSAISYQTKNLLYGVTHGGIFKDLRVRSVQFVDKYFEGIALGGAHKDRKTLYQVVEWTVENISEEKPRHLLGIGEVEDLFNCIERGVDLFDCASPTRRARHGSLYVFPENKNFTINIRQSRFIKDKNPLDPKCNCYTCQNFSRAYLRHLYVSSELLYHQLASYHNIFFINNLLKQIREAIIKNNLSNLKKHWLM